MSLPGSKGSALGRPVAEGDAACGGDEGVVGALCTAPHTHTIGDELFERHGCTLAVGESGGKGWRSSWLCWAS